MIRALTVSGFLMAAGLTLTAAPADLESRRKAMKDLLAEQWEYTLSHSPEFASVLGDKRWNDKVSDFSQEEIERDLAKTKEFLNRFEAIDPTGFPEQEALTRTLLVRSFREQLEDARFKNWEMPVTQIYGIHLDAPQLVSLLSTSPRAASASWRPPSRCLCRRSCRTASGCRKRRALPEIPCRRRSPAGRARWGRGRP